MYILHDQTRTKWDKNILGVPPPFSRGNGGNVQQILSKRWHKCVSAIK